ncbi:MAG TPA: hypothetical protein VGK14_04235 [Novimethylophilus sp.]|uniref:hypothetical protein n=1 Tax=Novimethylophilus sp. TaxID=2137426 RepID=UPI002F4118BC
MSYALLAFMIILASALLVTVHKAFALLLPIGVLVFFLPNLMGLWTRLQAGHLVGQQLVMVRQGNPNSAVVLKNEHGGIDAQAVWLDPPQGKLGFISGNKDSLTNAMEMLRSVRAVFAEETYAVSFHEGRIRIPPRYILVFEFESGEPFQLVTMKRRRMLQWVKALHPHVADRLDTRILDERI